MSRKSRQKKGRSMLAKLPPAWVLLFLLTAGLGMGALSLSAPWPSRPAACEDTLPLRASMAQAAGDYDYHRKRGWDLDEINLFFSDHAPLHISSKVASEPLLAKLKAYLPVRYWTCVLTPTA